MLIFSALPLYNTLSSCISNEYVQEYLLLMQADRTQQAKAIFYTKRFKTDRNASCHIRSLRLSILHFSHKGHVVIYQLSDSATKRSRIYLTYVGMVVILKD